MAEELTPNVDRSPRSVRTFTRAGAAGAPEVGARAFEAYDTYLNDHVPGR